MKYQFCIRFKNIDFNSSASKAVLDCNKIFSANGYKDYTFTVGDNSNKRTYYFNLAKELIHFFFSIKRFSIVGIQYPLLSVNEVFKYFIKVSRIKRVRFICIVHDLESLRQGGNDSAQIAKEIKNLSFYDTIIVHNEVMKNWLTNKGLKAKMISLELFDYLSDDFRVEEHSVDEAIVFAGNLSKSTFVYTLNKIPGKNFTLYGPGLIADQLTGGNINWGGVYSPDEIPQKLKGSFGLIWDGDNIDECDKLLGNYLNYNNPHKASLYLAAGMPIIAPQNSAIAALITKLNIGVLVDSLNDLENFTIDSASYLKMRRNVLSLRKSIIKGVFFESALKSIGNEHHETR